MEIQGVLETSLYATDLEAAECFYGDVLGLPVVARESGRHVFFRCGASMLLVFNPLRSAAVTAQVVGVPIPAHGSSGPGHVCFRVTEPDIAGWRARLIAAGIDIEAEVNWPRGGQSLYVRDPSGNSIEFAPIVIWRFGEGEGTAP